jgi:hypothetical protein
MLDAEFGELVARRLAALTEPALDGIIAKVDTILAGIEDLKGKLLLIEEHYRSCLSIQAREGIR